MTTLFMASLGCAKNLVDAEVMLGETLGDEFALESSAADADVIIVNTCGFIEDARNEAREVIAEYLALKASRPEMKVVAAGCWAERDAPGIRTEFPELDAVWGLAAPSCLRERLRGLLSGGSAAAGVAAGPAVLPRTGARLLTTLPSYSYLRISDGCANRCRYCAIPLIRGGLRNLPQGEILREARELEQQGVKELVVIAQDTTAYAADAGGAGTDGNGNGGGLAGLLEALLAAVSVPRVRILYAHPAHIDDRVIDLLASEPRLCRYLDLPIQHISDSVLSAMGRGYGRQRVMDLLTRLTKADVTIRSTLLLGFPGESEEDFRSALRLVEEGWFRQLGAFAYSPEPGTPAASLPGQIPPEEAARRRDAVLEAQAGVAAAWLDGRLGGTERVLLDSPAGEGLLAGRSRHEAPDADGLIFVKEEPNLRPGVIVNACITGREGYDLFAQVVRPAGGKRAGPGRKGGAKRKPR